MTKSYVKTATRTTLKVEANLNIKVPKYCHAQVSLLQFQRECPIKSTEIGELSDFFNIHIKGHSDYIMQSVIKSQELV